MGRNDLFRSPSTLFASLIAGSLASLLAPAMARAEQFDLFDVMYTYTQDDALNAKPNKSHFYVRSQMNPMRPKDWTTPIDYRNGTVHVHTEVIDKPAGSVAMAWTLCYIPYKGIAGGYGCTNTTTYTEKGVYERDVDMTSWWQNEDIVWAQGIMGMDLVLKDDKGVFSHLRPDPEHFFPTTVRIVMTQVSKGSTYAPAKGYPPPKPTSDGGATTDVAGSDDAGTPEGDAATTGSGGAPATGGATGSDGSGGSTGATGTGGATTAGGTGGAGTGSSGSQSSGGCALAGNARATGSAAAGVLLFGLVALLRRRRR